MIKIAVIGIVGESIFLSVDRFGGTGETIVATDYHSELGGKGFNQAVAGARYGAKVSFLSAVNESDAKRFRKISKSLGVNGVFIKKKDPSPYAVVTTDKIGDNKVCVYGGARLNSKDLDCFVKEIKTANILLISNEVPVSVNERAVEIAKQNGVKVIFNPAPARLSEKSFLDKIDLFTPNEHETEGLENYQNVVVTLGEKGCYVKAKDKLIPSIKVERVVDTTGAGDTFNGILATCLARGENLEHACQKANIGAGIKVTRKYILNSIPFKEEVEKFKE